MPSLSSDLSALKQRETQRVLQSLLAGFITTAPAAVTAVAAPAGGVGAAAGAWDNATNRDAAIATINALRTDLIALRATVASLAINITA